MSPALSTSPLLFFLRLRPPPRSPLFPYTTLFRSSRVSFLTWLRPFNALDAVAIETSSIETGSRSEEHTSELQSRGHLVCRLLLEKKKTVRRYVPTCATTRDLCTIMYTVE